MYMMKIHVRNASVRIFSSEVALTIVLPYQVQCRLLQTNDCNYKTPANTSLIMLLCILHENVL